jgi:hypothetical protein
MEFLLAPIVRRGVYWIIIRNVLDVKGHKMSIKRDIPTEEEICQLPREAQVAFAARCARRAQPLFLIYLPEASAQHVTAIEQAIAFAELSPPRGDVTVDSAYVDALAAAHTAVDAAVATAANVASDKAAPIAALVAANVAVSVAVNAASNVASSAASYAASAASATCPDVAFYAALTAAKAADNTETYTAVVTAIRRDFEMLKDTAEREHWTDECYVPPEFFGPMWPEGTPDGWPTV